MTKIYVINVLKKILGVSSTMDLELVNESRVAIEYDFQLHDSGTCYSDKIRVVPSQGKVPHFSKLTVQVRDIEI